MHNKDNEKLNTIQTVRYSISYMRHRRFAELDSEEMSDKKDNDEYLRALEDIVKQLDLMEKTERESVLVQTISDAVTRAKVAGCMAAASIVLAVSSLIARL